MIIYIYIELRVVFGVTHSQYSATVHVFDGTLMICLWYGEGRVGWGGVGGLIANNVQVYFCTHVMLRYCTFLLHFHTHGMLRYCRVMLRYCTFLLHFHTHVMLRYCTFLLHFHTHVMLRYCTFLLHFHTHVMLR